MRLLSWASCFSPVSWWRGVQLAEQGIYLQSHPHSSFFYVLTGVHAVHLLAGILVLFYVLALATRYRLTPGESSSPGICATYCTS